jgi:DNA-binding response OmpR family regulator
MNACRVLIMEDDPLIGMLLAELLEEEGYDVCAIAATAADGVTAAAQYRPDLVIADAQLGDGSGISAIEEILRTGFVPHLFMTGNISRVKALRPDAVVIEKPFHTAELMLAIQRALDIAATPSRMEWA